MEEHHIDVISVQSFCHHDKVGTEVSYVHGVYLIEDVVKVGLRCIFIFSLNTTLNGELINGHRNNLLTFKPSKRGCEVR